MFATCFSTGYIHSVSSLLPVVSTTYFTSCTESGHDMHVAGNAFMAPHWVIIASLCSVWIIQKRVVDLLLRKSSSAWNVKTSLPTEQARQAGLLTLCTAFINSWPILLRGNVSQDGKCAKTFIGFFFFFFMLVPLANWPVHCLSTHYVVISQGKFFTIPG